MLRAIALRPEPRIAIVEGGRNAVTWVPLRGTLPDGSILVALTRDVAWIERDGCRSPRRLYPLPAEADPCAAPTGAPQLPAPAGETMQKTNDQ